MEDIEKYKIYLFSNFPKNVINKKIKQYKVIFIKPSPLPTPINKLYSLKYGEKKQEIAFITQNSITAI